MDTYLTELVISNPLVFYNILLNTDYDDVITYCRTHKEARFICQDTLFWQQKAQHDFNVSRDHFNDTLLSPIQRYVQLLTDYGGITIGSENFM